ncbi:hypothetical protein LVB87_00740 [Lysobacter sp. KIS68-7]|uniref:hypothetical protein n=1 Tax=Lysobacter sp. KIS68-7 TaxID=2904252 RepID=UPI001E4858FA|nr:hypothetical protein [Lysobacter sp. KIS68-7]UHQ19730.1 hypothetical protein LVB87_00740 [Lysobacter sp. KIS68-7]
MIIQTGYQGNFVERNIKVYRAHRALSWLYLLCLSLFALMAAMSPKVSLVSLAFPLILFSVVFLAHHLTAKGAKQSKPWARTSSIVISVLLLFGFPVGTLIGIYLLSNTWSPWDNASPVGA